MFGGGAGAGAGGDFWAGRPMDPVPPAFAAPFPTAPVPMPVALPEPTPFPQYQPAFVRRAPPPPEARTATENRVFEAALVDFQEGKPDRRYRIAKRIPGKTARNVAEHYRRLGRDLRDIEAGVIELPQYADDGAARATVPSSAASGMAGRGTNPEELHQQHHILFGRSRAMARGRDGRARGPLGLAPLSPMLKKKEPGSSQ